MRAGGEDEDVKGVINEGNNSRYQQIKGVRLIFGTLDFTGDAIIVSDDDDLHHVGTQNIPGPSRSPILLLDDDSVVPPSPASSTSSDSFEDIDEVLAKHSQKAPSQTAPSLYSLSQSLRAS